MAAPSLLDCLQSAGCRVFVFLGGVSLHRLSVVLNTHAPTRALLLDDAFWTHLYQKLYHEAVPSGFSPHRAFVHVSCHCEWFGDHVSLVHGDLQGVVDVAYPSIPQVDVLIFPTTPTLLHPQATSAAGAVHKLGQAELKTKIERARQPNPNMHSYFPPGTAVHTRGGGLSPWFAHLIHCVGPYSIQSVEAKLNTIALVYRSALMTVGTLKLRRIMIVPVGTGIAQCPVHVAAEVTMQCLWEFTLSKLEFSPGAPHLDDEPRFALDDVVFLCRDKEVFDAFQETKRALLGGAYEKASDDGDTMSIDEVADDL